MNGHTFQAFDRELQQISSKINEMGDISVDMLRACVQALSEVDMEKARRIVGQDTELDRIRSEIEHAVIVTIARRQPVADDLRLLFGAVHMAIDLERVGDLTKNIAKYAIKLAEMSRPAKISVSMQRMAEITLRQLEDVVAAHLMKDAEKAKRIWENDIQVDELEDLAIRDFLTRMMEDPRTISSYTLYLFCAKNLERIGDHATNVAEVVYFGATGEALPYARPKTG